MIHLFRALNQTMALYVGSGAVHTLDAIAFDALHLMQDQPETSDEDLIARLAETYAPEEARETVAELRELIVLGYLDTPDDYSSVEMMDTGVVKAMCLHAAHDCNLRCKYCFADTGEFHMHSRALLSVDTGMKALDWLVAHSGNRHHLEVDFFGGEPLMNFPVVKELVAYGRSLEAANNKRFKFTTTTNAVSMTEEIMDFLNKEKGYMFLQVVRNSDPTKFYLSSTIKILLGN